MILSGVNYVAYFYLTTRQMKEIFHVEEIRVYFGIHPCRFDLYCL